jgi:hypothetical protein
MPPPKVNNSTIRDLNNHKVYEISNNELKTTIVRMIMKLKGSCLNTWINSKRIQNSVRETHM